jgi:hypothetical protein
VHMVSISCHTPAGQSFEVQARGIAHRVAGHDAIPAVDRGSAEDVTARFCLQPHRGEGLKFSTDPGLEAKITDVVGLYLNPPQLKRISVAVVTDPGQRHDLVTGGAQLSKLPVRVPGRTTA